MCVNSVINKHAIMNQAVGGYVTYHAHEPRRQGPIEGPDPFLPQHAGKAVANPFVGAGIVGHLTKSRRDDSDEGDGQITKQQQHNMLVIQITPGKKASTVSLWVMIVGVCGRFHLCDETCFDSIHGDHDCHGGSRCESPQTKGHLSSRQGNKWKKELMLQLRLVAVRRYHS